MLISLAYIFLIGLSFAAICEKIKLPRIVGMLATGILLGPYVLNLLDPSILAVSSDLRQIALVIILLKAGLSLDPADLKKVGRPAILMTFLPATFEIIAYTLLAPRLLGITTVEAALMGSVLAAVSPAVVVPRMVKLMDTGYGTEQSIPQLIMAGASCDDIFVIVLFSAFTGMAQGGGVDLFKFLNIPISILLGILLGAVIGYLLSLFFETAYAHEHLIRNSMKVLVVLGMSFLMIAIETALKPFLPVSGLLAIMSMACVIRMKSPSTVADRLSDKFGKLWLGAEVLLFVLVGAVVDIRYTLDAGLLAVLVIFLALLVRSAGVALSLTKTSLTIKERLFCMISYLPKATVQAAIGSVPLALGLPCGKIILSVAVLGILLTAPLGALGMDLTDHRLLQKEQVLTNVPTE